MRRSCAKCGVSETWSYINEHQLCDSCWELEKRYINLINQCKSDDHCVTCGRSCLSEGFQICIICEESIND